MMAKTGMLIITNPNKFNRIIPRLTSEIKNTLYIHFKPTKYQNINNKITHPCINSASIINLYKHSLSMRQVDVRVLLSSFKNPNFHKINTKNPIEVVYFDDCLNQDEMQGFLTSFILNKTKDCQMVSLSESSEPPDYFNTEHLDMYNNVVLGGTFDRLHIGHKILLSEAVMRCKKKLTVGVTDENMLKSKKLWELIEPCALRINKVRDFLQEVEPNLEYDVVPISDVYGPTKDDPSFQLLVVSAETVGGGNKVNEVRLQNGLKPLVVKSVDLIPDQKLDDVEEDKVSSSNDRLRLLGTLISPPKLKPNIPSLPYLIGLTGGIGSGKSSLCSRLAKLGAAVIDCDKVAHSLYEKGTPIHSKIIDIFGKEVKNENGDINRRKLGEIVFNNKEKLQTLNNLLWPKILEKCKEIAKDLYAVGNKVVVFEAAVLIQAGWDDHLHEVWATIIPPEEALKRVKERNGLNDEQASLRILSQPSNKEFVAKANVIFSTLWTPEFSQKQIERAWASLLHRLPS